MSEFLRDRRWLECIGKTISGIEINNETHLIFDFTDGCQIVLQDYMQKCCEHRFMRTDDNLFSFLGSQLLGAEVVDSGTTVPSGDPGREDLDSQFLRVKTSLGVFTVVNYNQHNGYYGGFSLEVMGSKLLT